MLYIVLIVSAYLLGSIPFGKIIGLHYGIDLQKVGSRNIGFANAVKQLGWKRALPVLPADAGKGYLPTILAVHLLPGAWPMLVGAVAVLGHIFPIWLKFHGGKGIATGLGVMLALDPILFPAIAVIYLVSLKVLKDAAPAALMAAWALPTLCFAVASAHLGLYLFLPPLVTWAHRSNIMLLTRGLEIV
jgi:glycerol-3-phosphate acyltransferase PlsY